MYSINRVQLQLCLRSRSKKCHDNPPNCASQISRSAPLWPTWITGSEPHFQLEFGCMDAGATFHFSEHFYQNSMAPLANLSGMGHSTTSQTTYHTWMSQDFALRHQFSVVRCPVHPFFNGLRVAWPIVHLYSQCSAHFNAVRIGTFSPEATRILGSTGSTRVHPGPPGSTRIHPFVDVFSPMNQGSSILRGMGFQYRHRRAPQPWFFESCGVRGTHQDDGAVFTRQGMLVPL